MGHPICQVNWLAFKNRDMRTHELDESVRVAQVSKQKRPVPADDPEAVPKGGEDLDRWMKKKTARPALRTGHTMSEKTWASWRKVTP